MNNRIGVVVLIILCVGLGVAVLLVKKGAAEQHTEDAKQIETVSNQLVKANIEFEDQKKVAGILEKDLQTKKTEFEKSVNDLTNKITEVSANLTKTEASLHVAEQGIKERDVKIADQQAEIQALDKKAQALSDSLTNLNAQIADTRHRLAASEGDKAFLQKELARLMGEKTELERQFNDITILRAQVAKLKEEQNIARRVEWTRQGLYATADQKGAQQLIHGLAAPAAKPPKRNYDLNVEVGTDGSVRVIPPATNAPAAR